MNIGIIGAGHIGSASTHLFTKVGHKVKIANSRGPASLKDLTSETGATAADVPDAVRGVDLVVVTIPEKNIPNLPKDLFANADPKLVVIDTGNYYPQQRDGKIAAIEDGMPESRWVEKQIRHSVIKAFNNVYAQHLLELGKPKGTPDRTALPVAGDDEAKKRVVMDLIDQIGFDPVDAGSINVSWRQQPGSPVYGTDFNTNALRQGLQEAKLERSPEWRAT